MKVSAGIRLDIAAANVAEVNTKLSAYKFWAKDPLQSFNYIIHISIASTTYIDRYALIHT